MKRKILFLAEAVTWSQVVRSMVLARGLDPNVFEVHFAAAHFDERLFADTKFKRWPITSISPEKVEAAMAGGKRLYEKSILSKYVEEELRLYEAIQPELVISDLRWSTAISGPVFGVPVATMIDAYWSRRAVRDKFPVPDHPIVKLIGVSRAEKYFPMALPKVLEHFVAPVNELRKKHGLAPLGDLLEVITWGDRVLFPDDPAVTPLSSVARNETFLGPVLWAPDLPLPSWWNEVGRSRPLIYATLGSSGSLDTIPAVLEGLGQLDVDVVLSTAARYRPERVPKNVRVVDMIAGDLAARSASLVVCNGGASTGYQALAEGKPIVGIPSNLDAFLAMTAMRDAQLGLMLRASTVTPGEVRDAVVRVLREPHFAAAAARAAASFKQYDPHARLRAVIEDVAARPSAA